MERRLGNVVFVVLCAFCVLSISGKAFSVEVPEQLKGIPLYQGSTVQHAMEMTNHAMLVVSVSAKGDAVADFYRNALVAQGWTAAFQAEQENIKIMHFKKDKRMLQVTIQLEKGGETTTYNLVITSEQP